MGKSLILESPEPVKRVALAQPAIADVMVLSPTTDLSQRKNSRYDKPDTLGFR